MKLIWYLMVKLYVRIGFAFYFKKIRLVGIENIPKNQAILFVSNHQNALIDPLLIGAVTPRELHFLTRADVFNKPLVKALLSSVNMLPIYRIRDGLNSLSRNEEVFQKCYKILNNKGTVLIFPEGNHNIQRRIRNLSKGFTRIAFGALENDPTNDIVILPIGINYTNAKKYASSVSILYGKPISVHDHWTGQASDLNENAQSLKNEVSLSLKKLVTHIESEEHYDDIEKSFYENDFLYPERINEQLKNESSRKPLAYQSDNAFNFLMPFVKANSFFPLLIWKNIRPKVREQEFLSTFKFALGMTLFPVFYLLQSWVIHFIFDSTAAIIYLSISVLSAYFLTKSR